MILRRDTFWGLKRRPDLGPRYHAGPCEGVLCLGDQHPRVRLRTSQTSYHWDGTGENPNPPLLLCDECWDDYYQYYQDMRDEYHAGLL